MIPQILTFLILFSAAYLTLRIREPDVDTTLGKIQLWTNMLVGVAAMVGLVGILGILLNHFVPKSTNAQPEFPINQLLWCIALATPWPLFFLLSFWNDADDFLMGKVDEPLDQLATKTHSKLITCGQSIDLSKKSIIHYGSSFFVPVLLCAFMAAIIAIDTEYIWIQLLRIATFVYFIFASFQLLRSNPNHWFGWTLVAFALLYNPLKTLVLSAETWSIVNFATMPILLVTAVVSCRRWKFW